MDQMIQSGNLKQLTVKQSETVAIDDNNQEYRAASPTNCRKPNCSSQRAKS